MTSPELIVGNLYGLSNAAIVQNSHAVASELMWAVEQGYTKARCVSFIEDLIETILDSTLDNTHVGNSGPFGPDGDPELLLTMAHIARDDAINSGDVRDNARTLVENNYDRFKAVVKPKSSKSPKGAARSGRSGTKKTGRSGGRGARR